VCEGAFPCIAISESLIILFLKYKGLDVFEEEDSELFFGREELVEDLVSRVDGGTGPFG
jgi:hypothetical protein